MSLPGTKQGMLQYVHEASVELDHRRASNVVRGERATTEWQTAIDRATEAWQSEMAAVEAEEAQVAAEVREITRFERWLEIMPTERFALPQLSGRDDRTISGESADAQET